MERQKMKHRRQLGLRQGMLGIILLCWVLPVVLIVTLGGVYILDSMTRQYRSDMMRSAQSAAAITGRNLDSMIAASRKASYIATMGNAWASYTKTGDYVTFYNEMQTFLTQQYRYDDKFRNTIVTLWTIQQRPSIPPTPRIPPYANISSMCGTKYWSAAKRWAPASVSLRRTAACI